MNSQQIYIFTVLTFVSVSQICGMIQIPAGADETSAVHALSKRGWFGRSRSKGVPPPPPAYGHPYRPMPPPPPARRRGGFGKAAGMLLPVAAGAAAGYLTTSLVLKQMKKENPCALHGAGFTADGQMDSRIAANQRCQSMLQKYSSWFNSPNAGGNTNPQQGGGTMNPQQNGMMSPNGMSPNGMSPNGVSPNGMSPKGGNPNTVSPGVNPQQTSQKATPMTPAGTDTDDYGTTRQQRAMSGPMNLQSLTSGYGQQQQQQTQTGPAGTAGKGSPCAGATFATCQEIDGHETCVVQTPSGNIPIKQCA
nr:PREDICTED: uncharacterized protein LOC109035210 [Bemisia tabaci]